jgi:hypothetical protein
MILLISSIAEGILHNNHTLLKGRMSDLIELLKENIHHKDKEVLTLQEILED